MSVVVIVLLVLSVPLLAGAVLVYGWRGQRRRGEPSFALPVQGPETAVDLAVASAPPPQPGLTGLRLVSDDLEAFRMRLVLAKSAGRSLDLQYYYWKPDVTGRLLARELIRAADRGVRVRLLLDDINSMGLDSTYLALDAHPNIFVRLFNPSRNRQSSWRRGIELVLRYFSATRRMHNKSWITDGQVAIVGGRNIGDAYFGAANGANFNDLDLLVTGPAADEAERIFDSYWNSSAALPITSLHKIRRANLAKLRRTIEGHCQGKAALTYLGHVERRANAAASLSDQLMLHSLSWSDKVSVVADPPEKAMSSARETWLTPRIMSLISGAGQELHLCSPYFIPGDDGMSAIERLAARRVGVSILTNSLAATDVMIVHSAYAKYRPRLLALGLALYEQRPRSTRRRISIFGSRTASLHTKAIIADRTRGFIGSFNLDPRSASINTEMGIIFESPEIAARAAALLEEQMRSNYRLAMAESKLVWREPARGHEVRHDREPEASIWRRTASFFAGLLPIESQL